ncbi:MAG: acyl-CoA dehydrogenase [Candidatus Eisenbacteria bacterium]|uniref:Acyl-CoA dehydrogenase n=1 Tax=Eiseniibacteriota bacterium TaxID=2212470 RepID=A0A538U7B7_UNCEI|nr:MAG: acyl-CoA dehydrogenase [Candidatus Eisenbacteria bacterium]
MAETAVKSSHVSEQEARALAEASRETVWTAPSFVRELFLGSLQIGLIHPHPEPDPEEQRRGAEFMARLERFLREQVDGERIEHEARIPPEVLQGLRDLGAFGIKIPREYGGLGLSQYTYGRAMSLCGSVSSALVTLLSAHQSIGVPQPLKLFGTEAQKQKYLPRLARGAISAFALTEVDVGSDPARMTTTAVPTPDGSAYLLDGEKLWCTNGTIAELMVVMARTPGKDGKPGPISAFIVETAWPGVEVAHRLEFMGLRGIENALMRFRGVRVPKENLLGEEGRGLKLALVTLNTGRLTVPAGCAAAGKWCLQVARTFAGKRVQWGRPVGRHDAVAQMLAEIAAKTYAMEAVADLGSLLADRGRSDIRLEAALGKLWNTEVAWELGDLAVQVCGGRGYETARSLAMRGEAAIPLERLLRDLRINRIFEGTSQIMRLFIAREALDVHLKAAGDVVMPGVPLGRRLAGALKAGAFYAAWYPSRWLGWGRWPQYGAFGPLADHLRYLERASRRLARRQFHLMVQHGPALEQRQAQLFRCVDIGAELFAMAATCVRADRDRRQAGRDDTATELADLVCRQARRKVETLFRSLDANDDLRGYRVARGALDGRYAWLEEGIVAAPTEPAAAEAVAAPAEMASRGAAAGQ